MVKKLHVLLAALGILFWIHGYNTLVFHTVPVYLQGLHPFGVDFTPSKIGIILLVAAGACVTLASLRGHGLKIPAMVQISFNPKTFVWSFIPTVFFLLPSLMNDNYHYVIPMTMVNLIAATVATWPIWSSGKVSKLLIPILGAMIFAALPLVGRLYMYDDYSFLEVGLPIAIYGTVIALLARFLNRAIERKSFAAVTWCVFGLIVCVLFLDMSSFVK